MNDYQPSRLQSSSLLDWCQPREHKVQQQIKYKIKNVLYGSHKVQSASPTNKKRNILRNINVQLSDPLNYLKDAGSPNAALRTTPIPTLEPSAVFDVSEKIALMTNAFPKTTIIKWKNQHYKLINIHCPFTATGDKDALVISGQGEEVQFIKTSCHEKSQDNGKATIIQHITPQNRYTVKNVFKARIRPTLQEELERQRLEALELRKELQKNYAKPFLPPENVSAFGYVVYHVQRKPTLSTKIKHRRIQNGSAQRFPNSYKVAVCLNSRSSVEIASLTKIMTCILVVDLCANWKVSLQTQRFTVSLYQQNLPGTTANLQKGQVYTILSLLYGLMLCSGNDAAMALSVWAGNLILSQENTLTSPSTTISTEKSLKQIVHNRRDCTSRFIKEMNRKAELLGLQKTNFANPHGLSNCDNKSCAFDLAVLCDYAMNNSHFSTIVSTKEFHYQAMSQTPEVISKTIKWFQTHEMVHSKPNMYKGIKTGQTMTAGPCLSSYIQAPDGEAFIIIVLNSRTPKDRYVDTQILRRWVFAKQGIVQKRARNLSLRSVDSP